MKWIKPSQVYIISACLLVLFCLRLLTLQFWFKLETTSTSKKSIIPLENHFFDKLDFSISKDGKDPFLRKDFVNLKFLQLISSTRLASKVDANALKNLSNIPDFTFLLNELIIVVNVKNFYEDLLSCKDINLIQVSDVFFETSTKIVYSGVHYNHAVDVEIPKVKVDDLIDANCGSLDSDESPNSLDRCFLLKNSHILNEAAILMQLSHKTIARLMGLCVQRPSSGIIIDKKIAYPGVVVVREAGVPSHIEQLKTLVWEDRLKICIELLNLAIYLANTPLGSVLLKSWNPKNFIFNYVNKNIQLSNIDELSFTEPSCKSDEQCYIDEINSDVVCTVVGLCEGYNVKKNLLELNHVFLFPLLRHNVPEHLSDQIFAILVNLNNLKTSAHNVLLDLQPLLTKEKVSLINSDDKNMKQLALDEDPAVISMQKLPDGFQVDSWEQHEFKFTINEINVAVIEDAAVDENFEDEKLKSLDEEPFTKLENVDFPGRFDYPCPQSKASWGCVWSLSNPKEAMIKCLNDNKCISFVTIPHLRKEGWIIAIFKSSKRNPVTHSGTTVYIRPNSDELELINNDSKDDTAKKVNFQQCLADVEGSQKVVRKSLEENLMKLLGWPELTDNLLSDILKLGEVKDATSFKPARGKMAGGGQMNINIIFNSKSYPALFSAKRGPEEFSSSQLAVYQLDRMLGLFKTIPVIERLLSAKELEEAGFPVDIGGNFLDEFRVYKERNDSLIGVIVPKIPETISAEYYITIPQLPSVTNAVTPFSRKQLNALEYLILGYLTSIPLSSKGHQSVKRSLLQLKTEEAFLNVDDNDYFSFFYNCHFPSHVIEMLLQSRKRNCNLGNAIKYNLQDANSPSVSKLFGAKVVKLLELVDKCILKFGNQTVLYNVEVSPLR